MLGMKTLFEQNGINEEYFLNEEKIYKYYLWYRGAEYCILLRKFNKELIEVSFLQFELDRFNPENPKTDKFQHISCVFSRLVDVFSKVEKEVYDDRKIPFRAKPLVLWERFTEKIDEKGGK